VGCNAIRSTDEPNLTSKVFHFAGSPFGRQECDLKYTMHCVAKRFSSIREGAMKKSIT